MGATWTSEPSLPRSVSVQFRIAHLGRVSAKSTSAMDSHPVLLVDDDPDILQALTSAMEAAGIPSRAADSGTAAIDLVANGLRPSLILLDLWMPALDGWETWKRLRRLPGMWNTPMVILSAEIPNDGRAERAGARGVLQKPVTYQALVDAVREHRSA